MATGGSQFPTVSMPSGKTGISTQVFKLYEKKVDNKYM